MEKLHQAVQLAKQNWRDLLLAAKSPTVWTPTNRGLRSNRDAPLHVLADLAAPGSGRAYRGGGRIHLHLLYAQEAVAPDMHGYNRSPVASWQPPGRPDPLLALDSSFE